MATFNKIVVTALCAALALSIIPEMSLAAKKDKRSMMSEKQKKDLRVRAREYCNKTYAKGGAFVERIEIQSTGKVICWIRG
jgi:hypothetical protein